MVCSFKLSKIKEEKKYIKINELKNSLIRFFDIKKY